MVPLLDYTTISGIPLNEYIKSNNINEKEIEKIVERTRKGGEKLSH